ncbi:ABC transporter ATP-binding protein [Jeotgalibacillus marinus]|uniref:ABC transporter ATP-binding protein n=1 Tax=Jeotgalibacillus marinus TaxID=86667 RepID=A0ABV3Q789_9BACL
MLLVENLSKGYDERLVVKDLNLSIKKGESFGLLGPNGAGKSTVISIISGLFSPNEGSVTVGGIDMLKNTKKAQQLIGVVPQEIALYPTMSAKENLMFWGRMYGLRGTQLQNRLNETLEIIGLTDRAKDKINEFSGGMKRRVNIGASILHNPQLLIMDEPTVGIDPQSRNHILETVKLLNDDGMTIIYTSHYMEEVQLLCERIGIMDHGQLIACGTIKELVDVVGNKTSAVLALKESIIEREKLESFLENRFPKSLVQVKEQEIIAFDREPQKILSDLIQATTEYGAKIATVEMLEPNLESVFLHLTGRNLRD